MQKMNFSDCNKFLNQIVTCHYNAKIWAIITKQGLNPSNSYCYIGLTDSLLNIAVVDTFNINCITQTFSIKLSDIRKVKVSKSFIPKRRIIKLYTDDLKLSISVMLSSFGCDMLNQQSDAIKIIDSLLKLNI